MALAAAPVFLAFAVATSAPEPSVVYQGPASVPVGQAFSFAVEIQNHSPNPFVVSSIDIPARVQQSIAPTVSGAAAGPAGRTFTIPTLTVPGGGTATIPMNGTAHLDNGRQYLFVCDPQHHCTGVRFDVAVPGASARPLVTRWTLPGPVKVGRPSVVRAEVANVSGGPATLETLGWEHHLTELFPIVSSSPPSTGEAWSRRLIPSRDPAYLADGWTYGVPIAPGQTLTVDLTVQPLLRGRETGHFLSCTESEPRCAEQTLTIVTR
jgi:hypothetical protein